ncbi:MAG: NAD(P)-dependent oxidoreductase [Polyangiaceae bacterium]
MKVLVTGGSGFLGSYIAEQLSREGHTVRALVRKSSNRKFLEKLDRLEFAEGAVEDADKVEEAMKGVDAVIHSAGLVKARSPEEFRATNVQGTVNLLDAAKKHAPKMKRFVFISSLAAIGPSFDGKPVSGLQDPNPVTHYGRSKGEAERLVRAEKDRLPVTIIRPPLVYGPRDNETFAFFQSVSRGVLPILGDGLNTLSVIYASDAASACVRAIDADVPSGNAYFVDDGVAHVWREALADVELALGRKARLRIGLPLGVVAAAALGSELYGRLRNKAVMLTRDKVNELKQPHWVCSSDDTRKDLGWKSEVGWREGTSLAAKWYQENGWL